MTSRCRWLILTLAVGAAVGLVYHENLVWICTTAMIWVFIEWLIFYTRIWFDLPQLSITRTVNGRSEARGYLQAGRRATIEIHVTTKRRGRLIPLLTVMDCLPEALQMVPGRKGESGQPQMRDGEVCFTVLNRRDEVIFRTDVEILGAGRVTLPGFRVAIQDPQGFFLLERFIPKEQVFRILPAYAQLSETQPLVKRVNSLPQHGIHRLQRAGMGAELLELREYVPGDPPKSIAWKVSARRETLMTRQYESEVPVRLHVFVDGTISCRVGGYGLRLLDQMNFVASSVARSSISAGDPVGAVLFDERGQTRIASVGGERGFYRILEGLSDFAVNPTPPRQQLTTNLMNAAHRLAGERYPELLNPRFNQVPFTFRPFMPWNRRNHYQRSLLAGVVAQIYGLTPVQQTELVFDDARMAAVILRFLSDSGVSWMDPLIQPRQQGFHDGLASMDLFSRAISESVARARDNEVYVVMANLLESANSINNVLPAVKLALAKHHRVVFVFPMPSFSRPQNNNELPTRPTSVDMLARADQLRARDLTERLQRQLRRVGAAVSFSGEEEAIRLILAETQLARSGRLAAAGGR